MSERAHHRFWPARLPHAITPPATSLWDNLAVSARRYPDRAAMVFFGHEMTYAQLLAQAERLAAWLQSVGVGKGDRVLLDMQNSPQLVVAHFAILRADAVVVPINPMNRAEELKHYITDPEAQVAITTGDLAPELAAASDALPASHRLKHLLVTQFTDAFDAGVQGEDGNRNEKLAGHHGNSCAEGISGSRNLTALFWPPHDAREPALAFVKDVFARTVSAVPLAVGRERQSMDALLDGLEGASKGAQRHSCSPSQ